MTAAERRSITSVVKALITGSHILHHHEVLDAYGHLSVRHPEKKNTFLMPRNIAPALLSSAADIIEYCVEDASPVLPNSPTGYVERYIHSEIYKRYPERDSLSLQLASGTAPQKPGEALHYLEERELDAAAQMTQWSVRRPWELWER